MPGLSTPPGARRLPSLRTLPTSVDCVLSMASPEHFWPKLRFSALRLKTAAVFGSIDYDLRLHSASSTPPRCASVAWRSIPSALVNYLHTYIPTLPRHLRLCLRCRVRSHSGVPRNLRLLFRAVDAMPPHSILRSARAVNLRAPPTHRGSCHCHSVRRHPFIIRDERI